MSLLYVDEPDKGSCSPRNSSEGSDKIAHRFCPEEDAPAVNSELVDASASSCTASNSAG